MINDQNWKDGKKNTNIKGKLLNSLWFGIRKDFINKNSSVLFTHDMLLYFQQKDFVA
jgi:hypothetical protein